jgi:hypothetical protein
MSNAFSALIWWVVPAIGLIGALGYVTWVSKFQGKFQQETQRSVGQFQRFQDSLRDSQARDVAAENSNADEETDLGNSTENPSRIPVIRPDSH